MNKIMSDLASIARKTKENLTEDTSIDTAKEESVVAMETPEEEEPVVIMGTEYDDVSDELSEEDLVATSGEGVFDLSDDTVASYLPEDMQEDVKVRLIKKLQDDIRAYRKNIILRSGLTMEEADEASMNRLQVMAEKESSAYLEKHPRTGIVEIDKKNEDKVNFTPEEKEKLVKVKVIQLNVVENKDLETIKLKRVKKEDKRKMLKQMDRYLSNYSVPLPLMCDYVKFKGAQILQLANALLYEDSTMDEVISKKAELVYNQLLSGSHLEKYGPFNKVVMSFDEFCQTFLAHDLDIAVYGVLVASSMEDLDTEVSCSKCKEKFTLKYSMKKILNLDNIPEEFKQRFEDILSNKTNRDFLKKMYESVNTTTRVKSPLTNNMYDINYPTIARMINIFKSIDQRDNNLIYLSTIAVYFSSMYLYDADTDDYLPVDETEPSEIFEALQLLPQDEITMLSKHIAPIAYNPKFIINSRCPKCGQTMTNDLPIEDLVFLKAQDTSREIR